MKRFISFMMMLSVLFLLCACGKYTSSYKAIGLVRNQTSHSCEARFHSLEGQLVFKIKQSNAGTDGDISYFIQVDEGEIYLYYDTCGVKEELVRAKAGESIENSGGYVTNGEPVYIIIEATEKAKGKISVELDH